MVLKINMKQPEKQSSRRFIKKSAITVAASHTLHDIFSSFFAPLIPLLTEKLGFTYALAGALAVIQKTPSLFNPLFGYIADKLIIRWFLILSPLVTITAMSLIGMAPSVIFLAVLLFVSGLSGAVYHTTAPIIMRQVSGDKVGTGMSFFMFGGELARTLGPMIVIGAVSFWGLPGIWRLIPLGFAGVVILYFQLHNLPDIRPHKDHLASREPVLTALIKMRGLFLLIAPMLLFRAFSKTALTTFLPSYLVEDGMTVVQAGLAFSLLEALAAVGTLLSGSLSDKLGRKSILVTIMAVTPLLMYGFTLTHGAWQLIFIGLMGLVFFASTPVFMAMVHDMNSHYPALANGMFMMVSFAMSSIVALLIGVWGDKYGLQTTYRLTALLSMGALPFALLLKKP